MRAVNELTAGATFGEGFAVIGTGSASFNGSSGKTTTASMNGKISGSGTANVAMA